MWLKVVKYGAVGATGVVVNVVVLTAVQHLWPRQHTVDYLLAVEASIISNYLLNARFTFHQPPSWRGGLEYNVVTALGAVVQTAVYRWLLGHGWYYLWADFVAIPFATVMGFLLSWVWVFRPKKEAKDDVVDARSEPAVPPPHSGSRR